MSTTLSSLSIHDIFVNMSNAFVGTVADLWKKEPDGNTGNDQYENDPTLKTLMKENRYMYLALMLLMIMIVANIFFTTAD